ncbi:hypothetical protein IT397_01940 [Candidatus Nomurabacteria bacterium]|nr:hypothetical protein [Candidatus Nomurabacteria bacterium]
MKTDDEAPLKRHLTKEELASINSLFQRKTIKRLCVELDAKETARRIAYDNYNIVSQSLGRFRTMLVKVGLLDLLRKHDAGRRE